MTLAGRIFLALCIAAATAFVVASLAIVDAGQQAQSFEKFHRN